MQFMSMTICQDYQCKRSVKAPTHSNSLKDCQEDWREEACALSAAKSGTFLPVEIFARSNFECKAELSSFKFK
jgi:hypothetical protein